MKQWLLATIFVLISTNLSAQQAPRPANWEIYRSDVLKFEIWHPAEWRIDETTKNFVVISPSSRIEWVHGVGVPPPPNPWVAISPSSTGCATLPTSGDFKPLAVVDDTPPVLQVLFVCRNGIFLEFGYWESDPNREETRKNLLVVLESFRTN